MTTVLAYVYGNQQSVVVEQSVSREFPAWHYYFHHRVGTIIQSPTFMGFTKVILQLNGPAASDSLSVCLPIYNLTSIHVYINIYIYNYVYIYIYSYIYMNGGQGQLNKHVMHHHVIGQLPCQID